MLTPAYNNYILLPKPGVRFPDDVPDTRTEALFSKLTTKTRLNDVLNGGITSKSVVLDTTGQSGAKLVRLSDDELVDLRTQLPGVRIVPEQFYYTQRLQYHIERKPGALSGKKAVVVRIRLLEVKTDQPVVGATVVAFTSFANREGEQGVSDEQGLVSFKSIGGRAIEQVFIYPKLGHWSFWQKTNKPFTDGQIIALQPVKLDYEDAKNFFYPSAADTDGQGVKVGVIDTGIGPHPDLTPAGGLCTVTGEDPADFADADEHGTHVSGIIAAHGNPPAGVRGVAPGVQLYMYRVFGKSSAGASNFAIIKAIEQAVSDGCDLINMSLGGGPADSATEDAITYAHDHGTVCFVATGNDGRQPVSFPASFSLSLAVGAMGRKGTFPAHTTDAPNVAAPYGDDKKNFIAAFSNIGPEVDFVAPGVGIISSVPGGYAPLSGTSMACPMATGIAARLLADESTILAMPRDTARAEAMVRFLATKAKSLGFGATFEGIGQFTL